MGPVLPAKLASGVPVSPTIARCSLLMFRFLLQDVKGVDLSYSLIPSWDVVALIATELPSLERLSLKYAFVSIRSVLYSFPSD